MQVFADGARGATYSNTGDAIIVWNDASRVVVYDASAESELHAATMEGTSKISAVFADSGSGFLYVVALDGLVTRWDLTADRIESQWRIPKPRAHRVAMGPGFRFMAFSHQFDVLRIDDLLDPDPPIDAMATGEKLDRLAFTQDSRFLISAGRSRVTARARSTAWATDWIRDFECPVTSLCVATSDNSYAIGFEDGTVSLCHIAPLPLFHPIAKELIRPRMMVLDSAEGAVWTVGASLDRLDLASSERQSFPLTGDRDYLAIAGPMNQRVFISGRSEPIIYAVSESDREPRPFITTRNRIRSLAADERRNVLYSGDFKGNFEAWDAQTAENQFTKSLGTSAITAILVHHEPDMLVTGDYEGNVVFWTREGKPVGEWQAHDGAVTDMALSKNGQLLFSCSNDRTLAIHQTSTGALVKRIRYHRERLQALALSPDEQTIAAGGRDKVITLWDAMTGELQGTLNDHRDTVTDLLFTPDGNSLLSLSRDGSALNWTPAVK